MSDNPYQAPAVQDVVAPAAPTTEAEEIRKQHLKHEASLKAVGFLYLIGAVIMALSMVGLFAARASIGTQAGEGTVVYWTMIALMVAVGIAQFVAGWGLRKLRPWVKIPAAILAGISMIRLLPSFTVAGVIGALFAAYVLYLLFSAKGRTILSPGYAEIMAQTPHLRYRTPLWIWIALIVFIVLVLAVALFSGPAR